MKRWRIEARADTLLPLWLATGVIQGVGTPALAQCFLRTIQGAMPASHCTIFALEESGHASVVSAASSYGDVAAATAREYIRQGFDRQDSNMVWLARRKTPRRSQAWLSHQDAEEVANPAYRRLCYGENSIRERVSVLLLLDSGQRIAISFYRNLAFEGFVQSDLAWISACAPLLMAAVVAHVRKTTADAPLTPVREKILVDLPHRERQVMSHVLEGRTTKEVADLLRLSATTVLTYRYRAFAKLGVRTHRELLALVDRGSAKSGHRSHQSR
jgi:DNA-binding CsgD family transcriptional regulator